MQITSVNINNNKKEHTKLSFYLKKHCSLVKQYLFFFLTEIWSSFRYSNFRGKLIYFSNFPTMPLCILNHVINPCLIS